MTGSEDIVILLLGQTGAGKSSFVNAGGGRPTASVGHGLMACTSGVQAHQVTRKEHNILLIDTPGFNQTNQGDRSIMEQIKTYLNSLGSTACFGAVLVFIPLNESRQAEMKREITSKLVSQLAKDRVAFVTVAGNDVSDQAAEKREATVRRPFDGDSRPTFTRRFDFTPDSACSILDEVLAKGGDDLQMLRNAFQAAYGSSTPKTQSKPKRRAISLLKRLFGLR